jgi:hypothetical protein
MILMMQQQVPPKHRYISARIGVVASYSAEIFIITAIRASKLRNTVLLQLDFYTYDLLHFGKLFAAAVVS